ncbi:unnamed protein product [Schistocephalus solidus]|uniref:Transposase n=1 Tax=Schistocephalus solidus TaxID=70667 RepID=A0A183T137_SCHSO|nr:unnamed protein product [Schistocephalus solidus]
MVVDDPLVGSPCDVDISGLQIQDLPLAADNFTIIFDKRVSERFTWPEGLDMGVSRQSVEQGLTAQQGSHWWLHPRPSGHSKALVSVQ